VAAATRSVKKSPPKESKSLVPSVGDKAPLFDLDTDNDGEISMKSLIGKKVVVLYFYPKDDTPGCTRQACAFQEAQKKLSALSAVVIGVSPDSVERHAKFRTKYGLEFLLASDPEHKIADAYGVWTLKKNYGKTYWGIQRSTFIIDLKGRISHVWPKVSVDGHDEQVLEALKSL
jgi:peroxiredoxin Q/BCP